MSKNLTRKGLALGTALAFVVTGFTGIAPASAAAGDVVSIAPTVGTGYGAYDNDSLGITATADADVVTTAALQKLSFKITAEADSIVKVSTAVWTSASSGTCTSVDFGYYTVDSNGNKSALTAIDAIANSTSVTRGNCGNAADRFTSINLGATENTIVVTAVGGTYSSGTAIAAATSPAVKQSIRVNQVNADNTNSYTGNKNSTLTVAAWIDSDSDALFEDTDKYPSKTETLSFYDASNVRVTPRIERFVGSATNLNSDDMSTLGASLAFSPALNLDDVTLGSTQWGFETSTNDAAAASKTFTADLLAGNTTHSVGGRIYGTVNTNPADTEKYSFIVTRKDAGVTSTATTVVYTTAGYTVAKQATDGLSGVAGVLVNQTSDSEQASKTATEVVLRSGVKSFKYTMSGTAVTTTSVRSNVPVIAKVVAVDLNTGSTLTVGSQKLTEGQATLVTGVTDADGEFAVTVESSTAKAGEDYSVTFYVLGGGSGNSGDYVAGSVFTPVYEDAAADEMDQAADILSGSTVTVKYTLTDQFGKAISATSAGTAYTVEVTANDTTKLKKYATFSNGAASVTFTNYLEKGQNDSIRGQLGTGVDTLFDDNTTITGNSQTASLYNPEAAAAVTTSATLVDKAITYDAFITGTADATTNPAPLAEDGFTLSGTVVDTTGTGIPGAVVTVKAKGLQFVKVLSGSVTGDYYKDSITVAADEAGAYSVKIWAHKVSSTGITITTTAGAKSATTKLTTVANGASTGDAADAGDITADDLVFTWNAPKHPAVDTTYIVTGKVTDKWGNGISAAKVTVAADGALEVNGEPTIERVTSASGTFRVYFRSLLKTDGVANITATLKEAVAAGTTIDNTSGSDEFAAAETFVNVLSSDLTVGADAVAVAGKAAGTAKVTAYNAKGKTVTVYVAGKKVATKKATSSSYSFTVKAKSGAVVKVQVGSTTFFNTSVN